MDVQQLKLLAGRIRDLLAQANVTVNHSQALDLSGALVGLRNWPEVQAFPSRVSAAQLDLAGTSRLAHRLHRKHGLELSAQELLEALHSEAAQEGDDLPQVWPTGPRPGVYITMEQSHIDALLAAYEEATDGALVYAEDAGRHWETSINLGDNGLWSNGLDTVPSGTLLVLGPYDLNQQSWDDTSSRIETACLKAQAYGHRVAVLLETETPETLFHDVDLMVRLREPDGDDAHEALLGIVGESGELVQRDPFVDPLPSPAPPKTEASLQAIPAHALTRLREALEQHPTGLLLLGSSELTEHRAVELVNAALVLTDFAGPAARIRPRNRSTPEKDWQVPEALKRLPFLPSVQSAYSLGYRRMVVDPAYTDEELLDLYGDEVLFIAGNYGGSVEDVFLSGIQRRRYEECEKALKQHIAILAVTPVKTAKLDLQLIDMYVPNGEWVPKDDKFDAVLETLRVHRCLKSDEMLEQLLQSGKVAPATLKKALPRVQWVSQYLSARTNTHAGATA